MAKQGQRQNDASGPSSGRNNPRESVEITAGTPKKRETYEEQAREGKNPAAVAQRHKPEPATRDRRTPNGKRIDSPAGRRSGSDSNRSD
jgi:hypothetical protein